MVDVISVSHNFSLTRHESCETCERTSQQDQGMMRRSDREVVTNRYALAIFSIGVMRQLPIRLS